VVRFESGYLSLIVILVDACMSIDEMVDNDPLIYSQTVTRVPSRAEPWRTDGWTDGRVGAG